jgi:hypothetical protein
MGGSFFEDTPNITARYNTSQAFIAYSVALPFGDQKIQYVMITAGYLHRTVKKQGQLSKISQTDL